MGIFLIRVLTSAVALVLVFLGACWVFGTVFEGRELRFSHWCLFWGLLIVVWTRWNERIWR